MRQVPDDPDWPQMIFAPQIQNLVHDLRWRLIGWVLRNRFGVLQTSFAMLLIRFPPSLKAGSPNPKIPTRFARIADLLGILTHSPFTLDVSFFVRHENLLHPKLGNLQEVSPESVHIYKRRCGGINGGRSLFQRRAPLINCRR